MYKHHWIRMFMGVGSFCAISAAAQSQVSFEFETVVSGGSPDIPAARVTISNAGVDTVDVLIENLVPSGTQFISTVYLNLDPYVPVTGSFSSPVEGVGSSQDGYNSVARKFDIEIDLSTSEGSRLGPTMSTTLQLFGSGLTWDDFNAFCSGPNTDATAMVHLQALNSNPEDSAKVIANSESTHAVPEPATLAVLGVGLAAALRRKLRR